MEIIILKNGNICARTSSEGTADDFEMVVFETIPEYPTEDAGTAKRWELTYTDGVLSWEAVDRALTTEEKIANLEAELQATKILMGVEE